MQRFTYPIVFVFNEETKLHNGYIPDLGLFSGGDTPEETYSDMELTLKNFMFLSVRYSIDPPAPSTLDETVAKWPGYKVSLISAEIK